MSRSRVRRAAFRVACAALGATVGALAVFGVSSLAQRGGGSREPGRAERRAPDGVSPGRAGGRAPDRVGRGRAVRAAPIIKAPAEVAPRRTLLVAWAPGGVPPRTERVLESTRGVVDATTVEAGLDWISSTRGPDGALLDRPRGGLRIPFENAYVDPSDYADFVPPAERGLVRSLRRGDALLARTSAALRGAGAGLVIDLRDRVLDVRGTVDDVTAGGYEAITAGRAPASWPVVDRFVLVHLEPGVGEARLARAIKPLLAPGTRLRVRVQGENPFLRYGDAVLPQMLIKKAFGEFAARPLADGRMAIDDAWVRGNIRTARVPILGEVTCHRALFGQLRAALATLRTESLAHTVNRDQFGGCFGPRFVNSRPNTRLSHHAWGIAIDINVAENPFGARPSQDDRLVEIMADHGFTWGGTWLIPDGMHFEWIDYP